MDKPTNETMDIIRRNSILDLYKGILRQEGIYTNLDDKALSTVYKRYRQLNGKVQFKKQDIWESRKCLK